MENPYWQHFCSDYWLQWQFPVHSSSLIRWQGRLGQLRLKDSLENVLTLARIMFDEGCRGHEVEATQVYASGQKQGLTQSPIKQLKRRLAIEPHTEQRIDRTKLRLSF